LFLFCFSNLEYSWQQHSFQLFCSQVSGNFEHPPIHLRNSNTAVNITRWAPGFPVRNSAWTAVGIKINKNKKSPEQGLFNAKPNDARRAIPLCEVTH